MLNLVKKNVFSQVNYILKKMNKILNFLHKKSA